MSKGKTVRLGAALIVSGPSGSGKSSICRKVVELVPELEFSVSCCTRAPRPGEVDGHDYHFIGREDFERRVAAGDFIEHAEVHGNYYGTLKSEVLDRVSRGVDVLLDIDVQGAMQFKALEASEPMLKLCSEYVFVAPPSFAELERRLRGRATEAEEVIRRRLDNARRELSAWSSYGYVLVNKDLEESIAEFVKLLDSFRISARRFKEAPFDV